jgi:hypothetical protein
MAAIGTETIPTTWDDEGDVAFFSITAALFPCGFAYGAGVLLASYDTDEQDAYAFSTELDVVPVVTAGGHSAATQAASIAAPSA